MHDDLKQWLVDHKITLSDDNITQVVRALADDIGNTLSHNQWLAYGGAQAVAHDAAQKRAANRRAAEERMAQAREQNRQQAEHEFGQSVRRRFFERNPFATEADFAKAWPELRRQIMLANTMDDTDVNMAAEREASTRYQI